MSLVGYAVLALYFEMHVYFLKLNEGPPGVGYCPLEGKGGLEILMFGCVSHSSVVVQ